MPIVYIKLIILSNLDGDSAARNNNFNKSEKVKSDLKKIRKLMSKEKLYIIRLMTDADVNSVEEFYNSAVDIKYTHDAYRRISMKDFTTILLIEKNSNEDNGKGKIIGISSFIRVWHSSFSTLREAYLHLFGISKKHRNKGFGTYLFELTEFIQKKYFSCIRLMFYVPKHDFETFEFFRKMGLNGQKVYSDFYKMKNGKAEESILMMKPLKDDIQMPKELNCSIQIQSDVQFLIDNKQTFGFFEKFFAKP
ncbi:hypothetical protein M9Y10_029402 [Tritrichomonas musculus]|uniref:N-acetyltransferase domain-containing protein n=1 Tax=Tritrichomonas musculus TaxID=1915356 RepID=A0ABR2KM16_9EUKA